MAYSLVSIDEQVSRGLEEVANLESEQAVRLLVARLKGIQGRSELAEVRAILKLDAQQEAQDPEGFVARTGLF